MNTDGTVKSDTKISDTAGGFTGDLDNLDELGRSICHLGDLDDDGVNDIAVGAVNDDDGASDAGAVWIMFLNADGSVKASQKISATQGGFSGTLNGGDHFGISCANLGDLDGDGVTDLAVGLNNNTLKDGVWILFLNQDGTVKSERLIHETELENNFFDDIADDDAFGVSVSSTGDIDGDGIPELVVGSVLDDDGSTDAGAVRILFLNNDGSVGNLQKISATSGNFNGSLNSDDRFGIATTSLGDLEIDGSINLAVGVQFDNDGNNNAGAVWILNLIEECNEVSNLMVSNIAPNSAELGWDAEFNGIGENYEIRYRIKGGTNWTVENSLINSLTLTGLTEGTIYEWKVRAVCSADGSVTSTFTPLATFTTAGTISCITPENLSSTAVDENNQNLDWDQVVAADHYEVKYRIKGTTGWNVAVTPIDELTPLTGLSAGTHYEWKVRSVCTADGSIKSPFSSLNSFITTGGISCDMPLGTSESGIGDNAATLNWGMVTGALDYKIKYRVKGTTSWIFVNTGDASTSIGLTGLTASTKYQWKVKAICSADGSVTSSFSALDGFSTTGSAGCPAPTGLVASGATTTTIDLDWDSEPAAVTYELKYRVFATPPWTVVSVGTNSATQTGLTAATTYQWRLKSVCAADGSIVSTNSATMNFTTAAVRVGEVDVAEAVNQDITIYSHQNRIFINFANDELANSQIQIFDISGKLNRIVDNTQVGHQNLEIEMDRIPGPRVYFLRVINSQKVVTKRLLLKN